MAAYHDRTPEEKRLFHSAGGRASQARGTAHRWTGEEVRAFRQRNEEGLCRKYGERALRTLLNDVEAALRSDVPYRRAEILTVFHGLMADRGISPREAV